MPYAYIRWNVNDLQDFPRYLVQFAKRFTAGSASVTAAAVAAADGGSLYRDAFGFRQIIVAATKNGKLYGLDSGNGDILWSKVLGLGPAAQGGRILPGQLFVTKVVGDGGDPEVALVAQRVARSVGRISLQNLICINK